MPASSYIPGSYLPEGYTPAEYFPPSGSFGGGGGGDPLPTGTTYLSGKNATVDIDGALMAVEDGSYTCTNETDEVTSTITGGFYVSVNTIRKITGNLKCVYDGDDPPDFDEGNMIAMAIVIPGGPGLSGSFKVTKMSFPTVNPSAAVKYNFDFESNSLYIKTGGAL